MSIDKDDVQKKVNRAKRVAARRKRPGGKLRKSGKHWYEIEAYFDERKKEVVGVRESGYMLGVLEDFVIVEVPEIKSPAEISVMGTRLAEMGIKALVIQRGIRFLRLKEISGEQESKLNEMIANQELFEKLEQERKQDAENEMLAKLEQARKQDAENSESDTTESKIGSADA